MKGLHLPSESKTAGECAAWPGSTRWSSPAWSLTTLVRGALNPLFGSRLAFLTYFPALVFSAWVGGWGGGLLALALSSFDGDLLLPVALARTLHRQPH